jgi:hypothetical protein
VIRSICTGSLAALLLAVVFACNENQSFPFSGPSCAEPNNYFGTACWQCSQKSCNTDCESKECGDFFACYCACPADHDTCRSQCNASTACAQCRDDLGTCQAEHCAHDCCCLDGGAITGG